MSRQPVTETNLAGLTLLGRGKVRDIYEVEDKLLLVASDRLSAFDVVLPDGIPYKGEVLTRISAFWFRKLEAVVPNHMISVDVADFPAAAKAHADVLKGRAMLCRKAKPLPVECVVRFGDPVGEILREGEAFGADLIAVTTAGRGALGRVALGSVAEQVFRKSPVAVMLVRTPRWGCA